MVGVLIGCAACGGPSSNTSSRGGDTDDLLSIEETPEYWAARLDDRSALTRREAVAMLGELGRLSSSYAPLVVPLLADPDDKTGFTAAWALANMGMAAHPLLIARLESRDPRERERAVYGVGELGQAGAVALERLKELAGDRNAEVRNMANWAIGEVEGRRMVADPNMFLKEGLEGNMQERIEAVQRLGVRAHTSRFAVRELVALLSDSVPGIRARAIDALAEAGPSALPSLSAALSHRNRNIRRGALVAISRMHRVF